MIGVSTLYQVFYSLYAYSEEVRLHPDVWGMQLPDDSKQPYKVFKTDDNDYVIATYSRHEHSNGSTDIYFTGKKFFDGGLLPETTLSLLRRKYNIIHLNNHIATTNKTDISTETFDNRGPKRCPQTLNSYFSIKRSGKIIKNRSLIVVLDKPRLRKVDPRCADTNEEYYYEKVAAVYGRFVCLDDGTFLVVPFKENIVLRFDADFNTKSTLLESKMFLVDAQKMMEFISEIELHGYQKTHDNIKSYLVRE